MSQVIETKVSLPAIVTLLAGTVGGAVYSVLLAFGVLHPSDDQQAALAALGGALLLVLQTVLAYLAPHTSRADAEVLSAKLSDGTTYVSNRYDKVLGDDGT